MIHLDTHAVVWLGAGDTHRFPDSVLQQFEAHDLAISPMVEIEMAFLHEIGRLSERPTPILDGLRRTIGLSMDPTSFELVSARASSERFAFTRDPFDRVIAAQAASAGVTLVTKDRTLLQHLDFAVWE